MVFSFNTWTLRLLPIFLPEDSVPQSVGDSTLDALPFSARLSLRVHMQCAGSVRRQPLLSAPQFVDCDTTVSSCRGDDTASAPRTTLGQFGSCQNLLSSHTNMVLTLRLVNLVPRQLHVTRRRFICHRDRIQFASKNVHLLLHSAAAAQILLTCLLLGAPLVPCCYCHLSLLVRSPTSYLTLPPVFLQCPGFPPLIGRPDPSRSTQSEIVMFHPSASSSPCGSVSSLTALTYPALYKIRALWALSSLPFVPFVALTHLRAHSDSSD